MADQLQPVPLVTPGFKGLNKAQAAVTDLDPGWAVECQNFIYDQSGRLAARQGWSQLTVTPIAGTPAIASQGELALASGTSVIVSAANNKLYSGTTTLTDVTGTLTITANNWQWMTFNGKIYGVQAGHPLISWDGVAASFVVNPVSAGAAPTGGTCGVAAFGRLWILDSDNQTIQYCNLLDSTTWSGVGAGSINMATVWTRGIDAVMGIAAAGNKLVIFGTRQIILYYDATQTSGAVGLNPANISVFDTVEGTGLAARDTVQSTGEGDLTFLSPTGVQSLQRLITSGKSNPVASLDLQVHDYFNGYFVNEVTAAVRSAYSPLNRFYVILLPSSGRAFCYDTRQKLQDGSFRVTEWPTVTWTSLVNLKSGTLLYGEKGIVGQYGGYLDNLSTYTLVLQTPYLALSNQQGQQGGFGNRQKILKKFKAVIYNGGSTAFTFQWGVDFQGLTNSTSQFQLSGTIAEYGTAEYGTNGKYNVTQPVPSSGVTYAEYGGTSGITLITGPLTGSGKWIQFGLTAIINGSVFAVQQLDAFCKVGNIV